MNTCIEKSLSAYGDQNPVRERAQSNSLLNGLEQARLFGDFPISVLFYLRPVTCSFRFWSIQQ